MSRVGKNPVPVPQGVQIAMAGQKLTAKGKLGTLELMMSPEVSTTFDAGKYYALNVDRLAAKLNMDYQALQQQRWSTEADAYLAKIAG